MFQKQQAANDLNKTQDAYNAQLQKAKELGLDQAAQAEPVSRSENDIQHTCHESRIRCERSVDPKRVPKQVQDRHVLLDSKTKQGRSRILFKSAEVHQPPRSQTVTQRRAWSRGA